MTREQIAVVLSQYGYSFDTKIRFPECSSIYMKNDTCLYPSDSSRLEFSSTKGDLLLVYEGRVDSEGNFIQRNSHPDTYISFSNLAGFTMVSPTHISEPYKIGLSLWKEAFFANF